MKFLIDESDSQVMISLVVLALYLITLSFIIL